MKKLWINGETITAGKINNSVLDAAHYKSQRNVVISDTTIMGTSGFNVKSFSQNTKELSSWQGIVFPLTDEIIPQWNNDNFPLISYGIGIISRYDVDLLLSISFRDEGGVELEGTKIKNLHLKADSLLTVDSNYFKYNAPSSYKQIVLSIADPNVDILDFSIFGLYFNLVGVNEC